MAVLTQRRPVSDAKEVEFRAIKQTDSTESDDKSSSSDASPKSTDISKLKPRSVGSKSLADRSKIPNSFYVIFGTVFGIEIFAGNFSKKVFESYCNSMATSAITLVNLFGYMKDLAVSAVIGEERPVWTEYARTAVIFGLCFSLFYVFFVAPFKAGFWTGPRTRKQKVHRYMGLLYLVQYVFAWVEFLTNYDPDRSSYLTHFIAINGIVQGTSAFFSFKVLPELDDAGYYSDKAVLSRKFVHENLFFTTLAVFGSAYYTRDIREGMRSNLVGQFIEFVYVFWPYILVRPFFPVTSFSNTGTTYKGRSEENKKFYEIGTTMVKIFYLWAKYFFGFFINYMVYLDLLTPVHWKLLHGMILLNAGTVSLAVFLHTLRFKKVLPPKFTFSLYIVQIYLSFSALPIAFEMFMLHPKLCALVLVGLLLNMTRSRKLHAAWCFAAMLLITQTGIEW